MFKPVFKIIFHNESKLLGIKTSKEYGVAINKLLIGHLCQAPNEFYENFLELNNQRDDYQEQ